MATVSSSISTPPAPAAVPSQNPLQAKALRVLNELPPFSPVMNKVLASLAGEDVSFALLGELIEKDTVIAGNLLALVNSAMYGRRSTVSSVRHAISLLGVAKLRNAVLGMSVAGLWNKARLPVSWSMKRFDMHSAAVAVLSDLLAQHAPVNYPEGAFVAGLFHDLGRLLIAAALPQEYGAILKRLEAGRTQTPAPTLVECEEAVLGFTHADLSAAAVAFWKLPWPVQAAAAGHHGPWPAPQSGGLDTPGSEVSLGHLVGAADQYINAAGNSISTDPRAGASDASLIGTLNIAPDRLERVAAEFGEEFASLAQFFA